MIEVPPDDVSSDPQPEGTARVGLSHVVAASPAYELHHRRYRLRQRSFSLAVVAFVVVIIASMIALSRSASTPTAAVAAGGIPAAPAVPVAAIEIASVPSVIGSTSDDATARLGSIGLEWKVVAKVAPKAELGMVLRQHPRPGRSVEEGATVTLVVGTVLQPVGPPVRVRFDRSATQVAIRWSPPTHGSLVDHYEIWRDGVEIGERRTDHLTYTDGGLSPGDAHAYTIVAIGENETRAESRSRSVTLPVPASPEPSASPTIAPAPAPAPTPPSPSPSPCPAPDPKFC